MVNNQFSRRNLSIETRLALAYKFKKFEAGKAKARKLSTLQQYSGQEETVEITENTDSALVHYREEELLDSNITKNPRNYSPESRSNYQDSRAIDAIQRKGTEEQKQEVAEGKARSIEGTSCF